MVPVLIQEFIIFFFRLENKLQGERCSFFHFHVYFCKQRFKIHAFFPQVGNRVLLDMFLEHLFNGIR